MLASSTLMVGCVDKYLRAKTTIKAILTYGTFVTYTTPRSTKKIKHHGPCHYYKSYKLQHLTVINCPGEYFIDA